MAKTKILLAGFRDDQIASLGASYPDAEFVSVADDAAISGSSAAALIGITRAAFGSIFRKEILDAVPTLRWIHAPGAGIEEFMFPGLEKTSFVLTNGKIIQGPEVAEHAVALLLSLTRRIAHSIRGHDRAEVQAPIELRGKTALIIGLGGIGLNLAEKLHAFGMRVSAVTEDNVPILSFINRLYLADELTAALPTADVVCMAAPVTPQSRRMIGEREFATMKAGAYFVNVSRGATVDTGALTRSVASGHLAGAGVDVSDPEPLPPDHPLRGLGNVVITPHNAGRSDRFSERNMDVIRTNIRRFLAGRSLINVVDKTRGF